MSKPLNKFSIAIWLAACVVLVSHIVITWETWRSLAVMAAVGGQGLEILRTILSFGNSMILSTSMLAGLGALIELVDQIRWNTRPQQ